MNYCKHEGPHPNSSTIKVGDRVRCVDCGNLFEVYQVGPLRGQWNSERISEYKPGICSCLHLEVTQEPSGGERRPA